MSICLPWIMMWSLGAPTIASTFEASGASMVVTSQDAAQSVEASRDKPRIKTSTVTLTVGDSSFKAYLAQPEGDGPFPGVLLIHEWWGLNDWVRQQADRFAEKGYAALAPDLYHGEAAQDAEHAHELSRGLSEERAIGDLKFAFEFLSGHKLTRGKKTGVIGWCMGGGYALKLGIEEPRVAATVVCYGRPVLDEQRLRRIKGPLLGIWGATDRGIDVEAFKKALEAADKKDVEHHVFPDAGHAFMNENNQRGYNAQAAKQAWKEIDAFFAKHLGKK